MYAFQKVKAPDLKKSAFDLSHEVKLSLNMGDLVPILNQEIIPGDTFNLKTETLMRFQPMLAPVLHRINVYIHYFFIPNRIIWKDWEDFITAGATGTEAPNFPKFVGDNDDYSPFTVGSLADYLGIPCTRIQQNIGTQGDAIPISQLPFRAYQLIYNEFYRDQNLQDEINIPNLSADITPGSETPLIKLRKRNWEKDYFTSALPWQQRGAEAHLPISGTTTMDGQELTIEDQGHIQPPDDTDIRVWGGSLSGMQSSQGVLQTRNWTGVIDSISASINDVRRMFAVQRWMEKSARFGSRYEEIMFSHFGVEAKDARMQKPEYLGGGKIPVQISEVLQQSSAQDLTSGSDTPLGTMGGHGITAGYANMNKTFPEHGILMGIMSVMPRTTYYQGLPKKFSKFSKFDYFWPDFAHLGEQEIKKQEIFLDGLNTANEGTFGYQERYQEYRTENDRAHGDLAETLDHWHLARKFSAQPSLNSSFIECNAPTRIFAVEDPNYHKLIAQVYHKCTAIRPIPKFGTPI